MYDNKHTQKETIGYRLFRMLKHLEWFQVLIKYTNHWKTLLTKCDGCKIKMVPFCCYLYLYPYSNCGFVYIIDVVCMALNGMILFLY